MPLQDNTEDFREDMARCQRALRFRGFSDEEIEEFIRAKRTRDRLWYVVGFLVAALATVLFWIGTKPL